jgi:glycosyltransferase involved in cell wall biosynthesis
MEPNQLFPNKKRGVVLFRGGDLIEAGIDVLIDAIKMNLNKDLKFVIISNSTRLRSFTLPNTTFITNYVSDNELNEIHNSTNLVLGQLSSHKRTNWTIPHKFYEAAYMGLPYLTSDSSPMLELSKNEFVQVFKAGDSNALLFAIEQLLGDSNKSKVLGINIKKLYEKEFSQYQLSNLLAKNL